MGEEIKLTTGVISSKTGFFFFLSLYQISAPIQPGNSGGPLFDSKGNVIGIVSARHTGAENVGYAIKTSFLKNLIESSLSTNIFPQTNKMAGQNLIGKVKMAKNYVYYIICSSVENPLAYGTMNVDNNEVKKNSESLPSFEDELQEVEIMPEFPGGMDAFLDFLVKNVRYPIEAQKKGIQGRVIVVFVVNKDGSIAEPEVIQSLHPLCDIEAKRIIMAMPKWKPGFENGQPVRVKYTVPILFKLGD